MTKLKIGNVEIALYIQPDKVSVRKNGHATARLTAIIGPSKLDIGGGTAASEHSREIQIQAGSWGVSQLLMELSQVGLPEEKNQRIFLARWCERMFPGECLKLQKAVQREISKHLKET